VHHDHHRQDRGRVSARDRIARRAVPRLIVRLSTIRAPRRMAARVRRLLGRSGRVELFIAFDDAYSAVALLGLVDRTANRPADLVVEPVVERGIPGDPAAERKRTYALVDARRLARRDGLSITRSAPLPAQETAFLAQWACSIPQGPSRTAFCAAAMRHLWCDSDGPVDQQPYAALWREHVGGEPPTDGTTTDSEKRMGRRRLYDTPVAVVHGQWFFAHERLPQIEHSLDDLGWRADA
jgi:2-hydroxychromene-2-carboxylate isomerase